VTPFFLGGIDPHEGGVEAAYSELRERSQIMVGCPARSRRIFKLSCRFEGGDCEIEVGRPLPNRRDVVAAILDHGREEAFVVHTLDQADAPTLIARPVYAVTDFA
jgi:hypothetical protein